jgi:hypothetical protein
MPECECCGEIEEKIYKCKRCGAIFCEYCGSPEDRLCIGCLDEEDYEEDIYFEPPSKVQRPIYHIE